MTRAATPTERHNPECRRWSGWGWACRRLRGACAPLRPTPHGRPQTRTGVCRRGRTILGRLPTPHGWKTIRPPKLFAKDIARLRGVAVSAACPGLSKEHRASSPIIRQVRFAWKHYPRHGTPPLPCWTSAWRWSWDPRLRARA